MISSIRGKIGRISGNYVEIEANNIGYLIYFGDRFLRSHAEGEEVKVQIYMAVSENDIALYGFDSFDELQFFKMLLTVSGVGPKTAAQILAGGETLELMKAVGEADVAFFQKIKGVGKKTAQRIIVDLKSKVGGLGELNLRDDLPLLEDELFQSLRQLGFEKKEIEQVTKKMPLEMERIEDKLEWCLKNMN